MVTQRKVKNMRTEDVKYLLLRRFVCIVDECGVGGYILVEHTRQHRLSLFVGEVGHYVGQMPSDDCMLRSFL